MGGGDNPGVLYFDNEPFRYDARDGSFLSLWGIDPTRLTLDQARGANMHISRYEVCTIAGTPYVYVEKSKRLYKLGNPSVSIAEDDLEDEERGGPAIRYPHGPAFRELYAKTLRKGREQERGR